MERPGRYSSSLVAGLAVLTCFTAELPVRGIAEMADALDLGRSTTHRYAATLVTLGYLEQGPSRKYQLSSRALDVALSLFDSMAIRQIAHEHLRELRNQTGWTVSLGVLEDSEVVYIDRLHGFRRGHHAVDESAGLGTSQPVHCSAAGKALLARLPAAEQGAQIAKLSLTRRTLNTITTKTEPLRESWRSYFMRGWADGKDEEVSTGGA
jgi:DNA-binding IclR family transcriptional regulator